MAYCDINDVYLKGIHNNKALDDDTTPTIDQANDMIDVVYNHINSVLYVAGVTIPVNETTSPNAYALLKHLNAVGAAYMVDSFNYTVIAGSNFEKNQTVDYKKKDYMDKIKLYAEYPIYLIDAVLTGNSKQKVPNQLGALTSINISTFDFDYNDDKTEWDGNIFRLDDVW